MAKIGINIATGSIQQAEMIVGIDLGTTNSLVAIIHPENKKPVVLKEHDGNTLVPSIIHFNETGNITVGDAAKGFLMTEPQRTIFSVSLTSTATFAPVDEPVPQAANNPAAETAPTPASTERRET